MRLCRGWTIGLAGLLAAGCGASGSEATSGTDSSSFQATGDSNDSERPSDASEATSEETGATTGNDSSDTTTSSTSTESPSQSDETTIGTGNATSESDSGTEVATLSDTPSETQSDPQGMTIRYFNPLWPTAYLLHDDGTGFPVEPGVAMTPGTDGWHTYTQSEWSGHVVFRFTDGAGAWDKPVFKDNYEATWSDIWVLMGYAHPRDPDGVTTCDNLMEGINRNFDVEGTPRELIVNFPEDVESLDKVAVVVNWHGVWDTAANYHVWVQPFANNPLLPFIHVAPESTHPSWPIGVEWQNFAASDDGGPDVALYDAIMICLRSRFNVDESHVHTMGFSAGGMMADLVAVSRCDEIASVVTYSGTYNNNPANAMPLASWPAFGDAFNKYAQMFLHGGPADQFPALITTVHFDENAIRDVDYLSGRGHDAVLCDHGGGHSIPYYDMGAWQTLEFFANHPKGTYDSPFVRDGLPEDYADYCALHPKD